MANWQIEDGMTVRSMDGEKLGKIVSHEGTGFIVEKGFFFPKDYFVRHDDVAEIRDGEVLLRTTAARLRGGEAVREERDLGYDAAGTGRSMAGSSEEVRIPVAEEELVAEKHSRQAGEVRVRKEVTTEHRQIDVPITKEEVHVERVPASGDARPGDATFQEGTVSVPVREEEVEIRKRPTIREEVRVSKTSRQEDRRADAEVRKENVDVEREGDVAERRTGYGDKPQD